MPNGIDPQVTAALAAARRATLAQNAVVRASAIGKALQAVGQSTAIAVQDATTYLRNIETISAAAQGVAMAMIAAGDDQTGQKLYEAANTIVSNGANRYKQIGQNAADVLQAFVNVKPQ